MEELRVFAELKAGRISLANVKAIFEAPAYPEPVQKEFQWLNCVVWDDEILKGFEAHDWCKFKFFTKMHLGRALHNCIERNLDNFGLVSQIDWKGNFILIDILNTDVRPYNDKKFIRVYETHTYNNTQKDSRAKIWDLVFFPECFDLIEELIRLKSLGVDTTVAIWNCERMDRYPEPFIDGKDEVLGEIILKANTTTDKILTTVVFHHEPVAEARTPQQREGEFGLVQKYTIFRAGDYRDCHHLAVFAAKHFNQPGSRKQLSPPNERTCPTALKAEEISKVNQGMKTEDQRKDSEEKEEVDDKRFDCDEYVVGTEVPSEDEGSTASIDVLKEVNSELYKLASRLCQSKTGSIK